MGTGARALLAVPCRQPVCAPPPACSVQCSMSPSHVVQVRTDATYPSGFMDVIEIEKTGEQFRLVYDVKGRFVVHRISPEEASYKLAKVGFDGLWGGSCVVISHCRLQALPFAFYRMHHLAPMHALKASVTIGMLSSLCSALVLRLGCPNMWLAPAGGEAAGGQGRRAVHRHARRPDHPLPRPRHPGVLHMLSCSFANQQPDVMRRWGAHPGCVSIVTPMHRNQTVLAVLLPLVCVASTPGSLACE
jgi:Ribosomal family S4e